MLSRKCLFCQIRPKMDYVAVFLLNRREYTRRISVENRKNLNVWLNDLKDEANILKCNIDQNIQNMYDFDFRYNFCYNLLVYFSDP